MVPIWIRQKNRTRYPTTLLFSTSQKLISEFKNWSMIIGPNDHRPELASEPILLTLSEGGWKAKIVISRDEILLTVMVTLHHIQNGTINIVICRYKCWWTEMETCPTYPRKISFNNTEVRPQQAVWRIWDVYPGSRILILTHPGSRIPDLGSRISDPGSRIPDPGSRIPDPGSRIPDLGSRIPDLGSRIQKQEQKRGVKKNFLSYLFV